MKLPLAWLHEFVRPEGQDAAGIARRMAACGFAVEGIEAVPMAAGERDAVVDFEVTANRPDCLCVYGLAREVAAACQAALAPLPAGLASPGDGSSAAWPVTLESDRCGRYALGLAGVTLGPSPAWLADRLTAAGVRPINNVVDVTNYVMLERGQPLHAFDAATLEGSEIRVRLARPGERLTTLDGEARTLDPTILVIADRMRAVALAGIMGGRATEVTQRTTRIALESAWFDPATVRAGSKRLGLKTEASIRFERGVDPDGAGRALARALELLVAIGAGRPTGAVVDHYPSPRAGRTVELRRRRLEQLLGLTVPDAAIERILTALAFELAPTADGWRVGVPSFRVDVSREVDLIEEVGRHWGFDKVPSGQTVTRLTGAGRALTPARDEAKTLTRLLCGAGLQEAGTFTFIEASAAAPFAEPAAIVPIVNPLSEKFAVLRPSLLPGLVDALIYNRHRQRDAVRLFELGGTFTRRGERRAVAWVLAGPRAEHWSDPMRPLDVFDAKGIAELVAAAVGCRLSVGPVAPGTHPAFVPGRAGMLEFKRDGAEPVTVGLVGELAPAVALARGLTPAATILAGEIDLTTVGAADETERPMHPLPRFPAVVRDLSIVIDESLPAADVRGTIRRHGPSTLVAIREFDRYHGSGMPEGRVSLSVRLTFRDADRTLTDDEVQRAVETITTALAREHGAELRGTMGGSGR